MSAPLTGRKVFAITATAFGIIIAVNVTMAVKAVQTFPGLEVKNSYVASQSFDAERAAQEELGWAVETGYEAGILTLVLRDAQGMPAEVAELSATIGRTTHTREDRVLDLARQSGAFRAEVPLAPGNWLVHLEARHRDGTPFRQRLDLFVKG